MFTASHAGQDASSWPDRKNSWKVSGLVHELHRVLIDRPLKVARHRRHSTWSPISSKCWGGRVAPLLAEGVEFSALEGSVTTSPPVAARGAPRRAARPRLPLPLPIQIPGFASLDLAALSMA